MNNIETEMWGWSIPGGGGLRRKHNVRIDRDGNVLDWESAPARCGFVPAKGWFQPPQYGCRRCPKCIARDVAVGVGEETKQ